MNKESIVDKGIISFRTLEIVAVTLAVCVMAAGFIYWQSYEVSMTIPQELQLKVPKDNILYSKNVASTTEYAYISTEEATGEFIWRDNFSNTQIVSQKGNQVTVNVYGRDMFYKNGNKTFKIDTATTTVEAFAEQTQLSFIEWFLGRKAFASTITGTNTGTLYNSGTGGYQYARNFANTRSLRTDYLYVGQYGNGTTRGVFRSFMSFPGIPTGMETITIAQVVMHVVDSGYGTFEVYLHDAQYGPTLTTADANTFDGYQDYPTAHSGTVLNNVWNRGESTATLNAAGIALLQAASGGTLWLVAISKEDYIASDSGDANEYEVFYGDAESGAYQPYLSITYTSALTVTTQSASLITDTTATLNGNITSTGSADVTVRGFAYGTDSTLATVISTTTDTTGQPFGTGAFTAAITGLTKGTNYYARAYATNSVGTGLGSIQALTSNLQSDVIIFRNNIIFNNNVILK